MKNLYTLLAFSLLLISCGTDSVPDENEFIQKRIGTFLLTSEINANYVGIQSKNGNTASAQDTINIDSQSEQNLRIYHDSTVHAPHQLEIEFTDSTLSEAKLDSLGSFELLFYTDEPIWDGRIGGNSVSLSPDRLRASLSYGVVCNEPTPNPTKYIIDIVYGDSVIYRKYIIDVSKSNEVMREITVCPN